MTSKYTIARDAWRKVAKAAHGVAVARSIAAKSLIAMDTASPRLAFDTALETAPNLRDVEGGLQHLDLSVDVQPVVVSLGKGFDLCGLVIASSQAFQREHIFIVQCTLDDELIEQEAAAQQGQGEFFDVVDFARFVFPLEKQSIETGKEFLVVQRAFADFALPGMSCQHKHQQQEVGEVDDGLEAVGLVIRGLIFLRPSDVTLGDDFTERASCLGSALAISQQVDQGGFVCRQKILITVTKQLRSLF